MKGRLLAYLLDDLDAAQRAELETALQSDPLLQAELDRLRICLDACHDNSECADIPPLQLATRTCSFVQRALQCSQSLCQRSTNVKTLSESHDGLITRERWSWADLTVGACILLALGALLLPALRENRDLARRLKCQENMHRLGTALVDYARLHQQGLPRIEPGQNAGVFVMALADRGVISREELAELVVCPATPLADQVARGYVRIYIPTRAEYAAATGATGEQLRKLMSGNYASSLGWRDKSGRVSQIRFVGSPVVPMLADAPSLAVAGYKSANHDGCGQNILFQDLSCRYSRRCESAEGDDHWFLNDSGEPAAGCHSADIVLGSSEATPVLNVVGR